MISLNLWKILFICLLVAPLSAMTSLILLTNRQQPLPSPQSLTKITNWSNTILLVYPYCPPFAFSLTPYRYQHPLFVRLRLLSSSAVSGVVSPFSCCSLCYVMLWFVLCNHSSTSSDHVNNNNKKNSFENNLPTFAAFFRNISPVNSGVQQYL